jgi:Trypsin
VRKISFSHSLKIIFFFFRAFDDKFVTVVGFGLLDFFGQSAEVLQKVSLQVLPAKQCKDSIDNSAKMCTYAEDKDSCTSDR